MVRAGHSCQKNWQAGQSSYGARRGPCGAGCLESPALAAQHGCPRRRPGPLARPYPLIVAASRSAERTTDGRVPLRVVTTMAAVYARTAMTDKTGFAIGRQLEECRASLASHGWDLAGEFVDDGVSGASSSRPALNQMMDEVCAGRVQAVVVSRLDRLGRSVPHLNTLLGDLDAHGVTFVSVADGIEPGSRAWLLQRPALSRFNELENNEISELGDEYRWSPDFKTEGIPRH